MPFAEGVDTDGKSLFPSFSEIIESVSWTTASLNIQKPP